MKNTQTTFFKPFQSKEGPNNWSSSTKWCLCLGERNDILLVTQTRVFAHLKFQDGEIQFDEFDIASCEKLQTIFTGLSCPEYVLVYVDATVEVLFCMMSKRVSADNVVQTFLF